MDFSSIDPVILIASLIVASTPILLAATGELIVEKSGVLNLGVEGMMIIGAISGFIVCVELNSPLLGLIGAALGGGLLFWNRNSSLKSKSSSIRFSPYHVWIGTGFTSRAFIHRH